MIDRGLHSFIVSAKAWRIGRSCAAGWRGLLAQAAEALARAITMRNGRDEGRAKP